MTLVDAAIFVVVGYCASHNMAGNPGSKLALRKSAVRLNSSLSLHPTQYNNKSIQNIQCDVRGFRKPATLKDAGDQRLSSRPLVQLTNSLVEE